MSNFTQTDEDRMHIKEFEYTADLIRFAIDNKVVVGSTFAGLPSIAVAIKRGLEHWLFDSDSDEDNIGPDRSIESIVGSQDAGVVVDLMRSDVEALTGGTIGHSSVEADGHHTPDQLARRWYDRWMPGK